MKECARCGKTKNLVFHRVHWYCKSCVKEVRLSEIIEMG